MTLINNPTFISAIEYLESYVPRTGADIDEAYDFVCECSYIQSFVGDKDAWDLFYNTWESLS